MSSCRAKGCEYVYGHFHIKLEKHKMSIFVLISPLVIKASSMFVLHLMQLAEIYLQWKFEANRPVSLYTTCKYVCFLGQKQVSFLYLHNQST